MNNNKVQTEIILGMIFVFIAGGLLLYFGFREDKVLSHSADTQLAEKIEVGAVLFVHNCGECHGVDGLGGKGPAFNDAYFFTDRLADVGWGGTLEEYIIATASSGRVQSSRPEQYPGGGVPAMPAWSLNYGGPLRDDQIENIAKYIMNFEQAALGNISQAEVIPEPSSRLASPVFRGQTAFISGGCNACHAIPGLSDAAVGPSLAEIKTTAAERVPGLAAEDYIRQSIMEPNAYVVEGYQENLMPDNFSERFSDQQIDDLITFLLEQPWLEQ